MLKCVFQKCLTTLDLTSLGVGSCVGTGMYLVAGMVARNYAGPGVVFSFIIAAVASIFSGEYGAAPLCLSTVVDFGSFTIRLPLLLSKEPSILCIGILSGSRAWLGFTLSIDLPMLSPA
jgi:hypothetical protein